MLAARIGGAVRCLQRLAPAPFGQQASGRLTAPAACVSLGVAQRAIAVPAAVTAVASPFVLSGVPSLASRIVGGRAPAGPPRRHPAGARPMSLWAAATLVRPRVGGLFRTNPTREPMRGVLPGGSTVRHVRLIPQRLWKRKPGIGVKGGQKLKSHSGAMKRFKVSANGKVLAMPSGKQHLNYGTSGRKRQKLRKWRVLDNTKQAKTIRMLMLKDRRPLHPYYKPREKLELRATPLTDSELKELLG